MRLGDIKYQRMQPFLRETRGQAESEVIKEFWVGRAVGQLGVSGHKLWAKTTPNLPTADLR